MNIKKITKRFQRSTRIDQDLEQENALDGFVLHETGKIIFERLFEQLKQGKQRSFTWTGSFGTGKSTLALFLAALLGSKKALREKARQHLNQKNLKKLESEFPSLKEPWLVIPIVGRKENPLKVISTEIDSANVAYWGKSLPKNLKSKYDRNNSEEIISRLKASAEAIHKDGGGLLFIIDEMGKFLEFANDDFGDIHIFQDIAENLSRLKTPTIFLGLLHQAFQEYTGRLDRQKRDEWSKIQGRFLDIPFSIDIEESITLICEALGNQRVSSELKAQSASIISDIKSGRFAEFKKLSTILGKCSPLHPLTTIILSALSRQRFGQNQRSIFTFLASAEPYGLQSFISDRGRNLTEIYTIDLLWDYLETNLEPVILASSIGHKWAEASETLERASRLGDLEIRILKAVNIIDLFGRPFGILATDQIIISAFPRITQKQIQAGLGRLQANSCLVYRRHLRAWSTFSGSDIDIDREVDFAAKELSNDSGAIVDSLPKPHPIVAKRHYHHTGSMRWFDFEIFSEDSIKELRGFLDNLRADGAFILLLSKSKLSKTKITKFSKEILGSCKPVVLGVMTSNSRFIELATEFAALNKVLKTVSEVQTDAVARKELYGRLSFFRRALDEQFEVALENIDWIYNGKSLNKNKKIALSVLASDLSEKVYHATPTLKNELLNRHQPSSNAMAACRVLMKNMVEYPHKEKLGIQKYPPELGLYLSLLWSSSLHKKDSKKEEWAFRAPPKTSSLVKTWDEMNNWLKKSKKSGAVNIKELYESLYQPPFGLRLGVLPLIALSFILSRSDEIAVYIDDLFTPLIDDLFVDRMLQDPSNVSVRLISMTGVRKEVLKRLTNFINHELGKNEVSTALDAAKQLAQFAFRLQAWVKNTKTLPDETRKIRDVLLKAHDPNALLFEDLPKMCGFKNGLDENTIDDFLKIIERTYGELSSAYDSMLDDFKCHVIRTFGYSPKSKKSMKSIWQRVESMRSRSGDMVLEGFIVRVLSKQKNASWAESLLSFVTQKSPQDWNDNDIVKGKLEIANLVDRFEKTEKFLESHKTNSNHKLRALSIFISDNSGEVHQYDTSVDLNGSIAKDIDSTARNLIDHVRQANLGTKQEVAALIKAAEMILRKRQ